MGNAPSQSSREDATDTAEAASYCDILGRGIDAFKLTEGATMDQALLKGRVLRLSQTKVPFDLGKGRHVSLPCNIRSMSGSLTTIRNRRAVKQQDDKVHDASALLGGQFHFAYLEGRGSCGSSQYSFKTYMTTDEHGFQTDYRLFIAPETDSSEIHLILEVEEQIPLDGNPKDMAKLFRKFTTHAVTGIEIGRWHDAQYSLKQAGSGVFSNASVGAGVGVQAPTGQGLHAAASIARNSGTAVAQVDEQLVTRESGGGRQIMMTTFTALSDFVQDPTKKQVLEDAIAEVARAPGTAAPGWDLETFLDFCKLKEMEWAAPPKQERNAANLAFKKPPSFTPRDRNVYVNTQQVLLPPGAGAPTGLCLCIEQENQISVSLQHTQNLPWHFEQRGFRPAYGEWRDPSGKAHMRRLRDNLSVDCRQVLSRRLPAGETGILTGLQLVFAEGALSLRGHFSPLTKSNLKDSVWKGRDGITRADSEFSSSASAQVEPPKTPSPEAGFPSYIDSTEYCYGLGEKLSMMHWVLVVARLDVVSGNNGKDKLSIRGKFALLTYT